MQIKRGQSPKLKENPINGFLKKKKYNKGPDTESAAAVNTPSLSYDGQYWYCTDSG